MKISILGCGWLGLPLAKALTKQGHTVKGSTTQAEKLRILRHEGIEPFWLQLSPTPTGIGWDYFLESEVLIINIPPRLERAGTDFHPAQIAHLLPLVAASPIEKIVYVSSTSVYPELSRVVTEEDVQTPATAAAPSLVMAENHILKMPQDSLVLRMGGLMGYDRIPAKYVSRKQNLTTGELPINYVHRDDAVGVLLRVIDRLQTPTLWNQVFNVVAPEHPTRRQVYEASAKTGDFVVPTFAPAVPQPYKIVSCQKLTEQLQYPFVYGNPLDFFYSLA
jgi:nucleoside-diphosphate-sugar epimerase